MIFKELSTTFHTNKVKECVAFYNKYFDAQTTFDCGWYALIRLNSDSTTPLILGFQGSPTEDIQNPFVGGVTINLLTADVDACYEQLKKSTLSFVEQITDHEWGDRAFSLLDPIGNIVYVYSVREVNDKYKDAVK